VEFKDQDITLEANTIFGASTVMIKSDVPTLVKANTAFGNAKLPDGNTAAVGTYLYKNKSYQKGKPCVTLNMNVVFGEMQVIEQ
jgi:predicted membrane protein